MESRHLVLLILTPFVLVFIYAAWHEYSRFKREGASSYGLTYDPETNTTSVGTLPDPDEGFDPEEFNPEDTPAPDEIASASPASDHKEQDTKS